MNGGTIQILSYGAFVGYVVAAISCAAAAGWIMRWGERNRPDRHASVAAIALSGIWAAFVAANGAQAVSSQMAEIVRNFAWIFLLWRMFANDGRDESLAPIRPVIAALAFVEMFQPVLFFVSIKFAAFPNVSALTFQISAILRMLVAVGALVLLHNLYAGASSQSRVLLRWSTIAMAAFWGYALNLYTIAWLIGDAPPLLLALRGFAAALIVLPLAIGSNSAGAEMQFKPSRAVTFQTLSLALICAYLLVMSLVTHSLSFFGSEWSRFTQVGFLIFASLAALAWLPSERVRSWLRVTVVKHLFQHRYDYREEWLRFTRTLGREAKTTQTLQERVVQAVCDITDSQAGLLLVPAEDGGMTLMSRWQWPDVDVPAEAISAELTARLETDGYIVALDEVRSGKAQAIATEELPEWMAEYDRIWAVVPLIHFERIVGAVVLARPPHRSELDWEDFDLLRVVGRQLASYLAEQAGHQALMEASRFDEFNRRIAFVMHDIKNLASQLSLLARNAEKHADNPEFRTDMLVTLRNSADKLNALLARLGRYGPGNVESSGPVDLLVVARQVAASFDGAHRVEVTTEEPCVVLGNAEAIEQALLHLVQNAVDASKPGSPVFLDVTVDGLLGRIEIVDSGEGMNPKFVRDGLFKPFVSSKSGGFGIGAFEARELIRAMGGRLTVESREGLGTRFNVSLPIAAAANLIEPHMPPASEVA